MNKPTRNHIHVLSRGVLLDQNHILLCKTLDLPIPFYFLPGGHVEHGESVTQTVLREFQEEAGGTGSIKRLLGALEYSFEPGHNSICHNHEYNFIFEVESPTLKYPIPIPQLESHIELIWVPLNHLSQIDLGPEPLQTLLPKWLESSTTNLLESVMI